MSLVLAAVLALAQGDVPDDVRDTRARWICEPTSVEVGEPFTLTLEISHPRGVDVLGLGASDLPLDDSWVVFDSERQAAVADPEATGRLLTRRVWRVASLDPGPRALTDELAAMFASAESAVLRPNTFAIEVRGVLAEGEDAPRPLRGFPDSFELVEPRARYRRLALIGGAALVLLLTIGGGVAFWLLRRRSGAAAPEPSPLARLALLETELTGELTALREKHYELSHLVRSATDRRLATERRAMTDEEWLTELEGGVTAAAYTELCDVLQRCSAVKYAGDTPTSWALEETFHKARRALAALGSENGREAGSGDAGGRP